MAWRAWLRGLCILAVVVAGSALQAVAAADLPDQRVQFREALAAAGRGQPAGWKRLSAGLSDAGYPLAPYIEYTALRRRMAKLPQAEAEAFIARWPDSLPASDLRDAWLREAGRRGDWAGFRALWRPRAATDLQCLALSARLAAGGKLDFATDLAPLWAGSRPLPAECDPVLRAARAGGVLSDTEVLARVERAATAGEARAAAAAAALLAGAQRAAAERIAAALRDPADTLAKARQWADEPSAREAIAWAFVRRARRDSAAAETAWATLEPRFRWDESQRNRILNAIALYRATSYSPDALARLDALPPAADDEGTREWRVRLALAAGDPAATLAALDRLDATQQADARWRYLRARMLDRLDRNAEARALFAVLAREANFHGFLAADWLGEPYSICPRGPQPAPAVDERLARQPDLLRAFEFRELGMLREARREWDFALAKFDATERERAAALAAARGWHDRAVFAYSAEPATQRYYAERFPLALEKLLRSETEAARIDVAWAYAIIRAESAWMTDARSHADAYGLMQLLPAVGKQVARTSGLPYTDAGNLLDPELNVRLGTRYLAEMAGRYAGSPWLASAAYNAGAGRVDRWLAERGKLEPDFFIETIPFRETREYVARVLAFSVIYDWRLNGRVLPLAARMPRRGQAFLPPGTAVMRKEVRCAGEPS